MTRQMKDNPPSLRLPHPHPTSGSIWRELGATSIILYGKLDGIF